MYSHISTTLQGLPTIRVFEQKNIAFHYLHNYNNEHTRVSLLYIFCYFFIYSFLFHFRDGTCILFLHGGLEFG